MNFSLKVVSVFIAVFLLIGAANAVVSNQITPSYRAVTNFSAPLAVNLTLNTSIVNISQPVNTHVPVNVTIGPLAYVIGHSTGAYGLNVIDTNSYDYNTISLGTGVTPISVAVSPDGSILYVTAETMVTEYGDSYVHTGWIFRLNTTNNKIIDSYKVGQGLNPRYVKASPNGKVFVSWSIFGDSSRAGGTMFDFVQGKYYEWEWKDYFYFSDTPLSIEFNSDGSKAYFGSTESTPTLYIFNYNDGTVSKEFMDSTQDGMIRAMATDEYGNVCVVMWNAMPILCRLQAGATSGWNDGYYPMDLKFASGKMYVTGYDEGTYAAKLHVYSNPNAFTGSYTDHQTVSLSFTKGKVPGYMALTPDGKYAYIASGSSASAEGVAVVDLQALTQVTTVPVAIDRFSPVVISPERALWNSSSKGKFADYDFTISTGIFSIPNPHVIYASPSGNGTSASARIEVKFSGDIDPSTVNADTFLVLNSRNYKVAGTIEFGSGAATFTPSSKLMVNGTYTVKLTTGIKDKDGWPMLQNYTWKFKTTSFNTMTRLNLTADQQDTMGSKLLLNFTARAAKNTTDSGSNSSKNNSGYSGGSPGFVSGGGAPVEVPSVNITHEGICTMEAKLCPDGSAVGRNSEKNCEFDACPSVNGTIGAPPVQQNTTSEPSVAQQESGDFFGGIISFFKSLFGMK